MSSKAHALRFAARWPLLSAGAALIALVLVAGAGLRAVFGEASPKDSVDAIEPADDDPIKPRSILGRVWFDRYPEKSTDVIKIWIWLGGGFGIYDSGSAWRSCTDFFEFERQNDKVSMTFLHDKKHADTKFSIKRCDDAPPFDLCLDLESSPRGPKRYYSFVYDRDLEQQVPWAADVRKAAKERARSR